MEARNMLTARVPGILKKHAVTLCDYRIFTVDAFGVRESSPEAEEFTLVGTREEYPGVIPGGEIWVSRRHLPREGIFLMAHALARLGARRRGLSEEQADAAGLDAERAVRRDLTGEEFRDGKPHRHVPDRLYYRHYTTIPDPEGPVKAWMVDGLLVRCWYQTDYAEGGHSVVCPWVPRGEIWLEQDCDLREQPYIAAHEYLEMRMMRDGGLEYEEAHKIASRIEFDLRHEESDLPVARGRRFRKSDVPALAAPEVFEHLRRSYLKR
jgi:hypothetical protein